jgi:hypothetical protein
MGLFMVILAFGAVVLILRQSVSGAVAAGAPGGNVSGGDASSAGSGSSDGGCCGITNDPSTWPTGDRIWDVARAVARAEGANVAGSAPDRYNNPGDLSRGDENGQTVASYTTLPDGENLIVFATKTDGWTALYRKFQRIDMGISSVYSGDQSWAEIGQSYAGNSATWSANVAAALGVDVNSTFNQYVNCGCCACG